MARIPAQQPHPPSQDPQTPAPLCPQLRERFRPEWILVPLCLLGLVYFLCSIKPVFSWQGIMQYCRIHDPERYTMLGQLCLIGILIVAAVKIFSHK